MDAAPQPSARLVRAVAAERAELERHRARLATRGGRAARGARAHRARARGDRRAPRAARSPRADAAGARPERHGRRRRRQGAARARHPRGRGQAPGRQRPRGDALPRVVRAARARRPRDRRQGPTRRVPHADQPLTGRQTRLPRRESTSSTAAPSTACGCRSTHSNTSSRALPATGTHDAAVIRARRSRLTTEISRAERAIEEVARVLGPRARAELAADRG